MSIILVIVFFFILIVVQQYLLVYGFDVIEECKQFEGTYLQRKKRKKKINKELWFVYKKKKYLKVNIKSIYTFILVMVLFPDNFSGLNIILNFCLKDT